MDIIMDRTGDWQSITQTACSRSKKSIMLIASESDVMTRVADGGRISV